MYGARGSGNPHIDALVILHTHAIEFWRWQERTHHALGEFIAAEVAHSMRLRHGQERRDLMSVRTMYDSTTPQNVPADAQAVAYYPHAWGTDLSHIRAAIEVRIDNHGDHADDCHALDVENGAADVQTAMHWVQSWHALHPEGMHTGNGFIRLPIVYISESRVPELRTALSGMRYDLWVAAWGVGPTGIAGAFAHQYTNRGPNGENYDISVITDPTWGIEPAPVVTPPVTTPPPPPPVVQTTYGCVVFFNGTPTPVSRMVQSTDGGQTWR